MKIHHPTLKKYVAFVCFFVWTLALGCERTGTVSDTQRQDPASGAGVQERRAPERAVLDTAPKAEPAAVVTVASEPKPKAGPRVVFETSKGNITIQLNPEKAPISVTNFLTYVNDGFYNGTIFHRVIPEFMVQGGGFTADMKQKQTREPIKNECTNGLKNLRGTIAMARTIDPDSATAQFFINVANNGNLDYPNGRPGYAVFGKVVEGMNVADTIVSVDTGVKMGMGDNPVETILVNLARVVEP